MRRSISHGRKQTGIALRTQCGPQAEHVEEEGSRQRRPAWTGAPHSLDLRERVFAAVAGGMSRA
jgi:hypothetical protein